MAEFVEVVDVEHTHRALQRVEDVLDRDTERDRLLAVDIEIELRRCGPVERRDARELGPLAKLAQELLQVLIELLRIGIGAVLQIHFESAGRPQAPDRRRIEREHRPLRQRRALSDHVLGHVVGGRLALVPELERNEDRRGIGLVRSSDHVEPVDHENVLDCRVPEQDLLHRRAQFLRALQRRAVRQRERADDVALILRRDEPAGNGPEQQRIDAEDSGEGEKGDDPVACGGPHAGEIEAGQPRERTVERPEQAVLDVLGFEQQRAQRRRERQRDHAGDRDRGRYRDRELLVELAGEPAEERDRHEHRDQNQLDGDDRAGYFAHRLNRGFLRRELLLRHQPLDVFQHHDGIVDDDPGCKHDRKQRQRVQGETEQHEAAERADKRHRHRDDRDQRRAPALQEHEHDEQHQKRRLAQRNDHLVDRLLHETRRVERDKLRHALREGLRQARYPNAHRVGDLERVRARLQEHRDANGRLAVEVGECVIAHGAQLDPRDIADPQCAAGTGGAQHDIAEIGGVLEAPTRGDGVDERLPGRCGLGTDLAGGILIVLSRDRARDVGRGNA